MTEEGKLTERFRRDVFVGPHLVFGVAQELPLLVIPLAALAPY